MTIVETFFFKIRDDQIGRSAKREDAMETPNKQTKKTRLVIKKTGRKRVTKADVRVYVCNMTCIYRTY